MRLFLRLMIVCFCAAALVSTASPEEKKGLTVTGVRYFSYPGFTRIVFEIETAAPYVVTKSSDGQSVVLRAYEGPLTATVQLPSFRDSIVAGMELSREDSRRSVVIRLNMAAGDVKDFVLRSPDRIVLDILQGTAAQPAPPVAGALTTVVIDPGHGGKDTGVVTPRGVEKSLTLEWALAVKRYLMKRGSAVKAVLTREKDQQLSLNDRVGAANAAGGAVFVSIHAARGNSVRVFILDVEGEHAARAAAGGGRDFLGFETQSEQQELLWQQQQAVHIPESGVLGRMIADQITGPGRHEAVQAPIAGLKPVAAPAVLVEIGVDADASRAIEAIAKGIEHYVSGKR